MRIFCNFSVFSSNFGGGPFWVFLVIFEQFRVRRIWISLIGALNCDSNPETVCILPILREAVGRPVYAINSSATPCLEPPTLFANLSSVCLPLGQTTFCGNGGPPRNHGQKILSQKVADFECRFPMTPTEGTEHHSGPF